MAKTNAQPMQRCTFNLASPRLQRLVLSRLINSAELICLALIRSISQPMLPPWTITAKSTTA